MVNEEWTGRGRSPLRTLLAVPNVYTAYYNTWFSKFHKYTFKIWTVKNQVITFLPSINIVYVETDTTCNKKIGSYSFGIATRKQ